MKIPGPTVTPPPGPMNTGSMAYGRNPGADAINLNRGREFYLLLVLLFILFSRIFDTFLAGYRIPSIAYLLTGIVALFGGQLLQSFSPKISKLWLVFTALITLSAFFSIWRGGSIQMLANVWSKALLVYFLIVSLTRTIDQCARAVRTIGWAVGVLVLLSL